MRYTFKGKTIGKLEEGVFKKKVKKSVHLHRVTNSWAIQDSVLKELPDETRIEIFDEEEEILYTTTAKEFRENCEYLQFKNYGLQGYLPLEFWKTEETLAVPTLN